MFIAAFLLSSGILLSGSGQSTFQFKLAVEQDGVYRVAFEDLDFTGTPPRSDQLGISVHGTEIPVWIEDGADGYFGPGDTITFVARHLAGKNAHYNEYSRYNIYWLTLDDRDRLQIKEGILSNQRGTAHTVVKVRQRLERDAMRVALPDAKDPDTTESWYMAQLSQLDSQPFSWDINVGRPAARNQSISIEAGLAGLSQDRNATAAGLPHHKADLSLNGLWIGSGKWNGQEPFLLNLSLKDSAALLSGVNRVSIGVPRRELPESHSSIIDVILLNWIEVTYPFSSMGASDQMILEADSEGSYIPASVWPEATLFSPSGRRIAISEGSDQAMQLDEAGQWHLVRASRYLSPARIEKDKPGNLPVTGQQADFLVITHPSLAPAIAPLAEYHRNHQMSVSVIDVEDVYDAFNYGIPSPDAIRDFISYAWHQWPPPAPRFVLLVGDASWDIHDVSGEARNLLPTLEVMANDDLAASDNGFVTVNGDDWLPDLAIGRIPAANSEELASIVAKLLRYAEDPEVGPWRRSAAWVADRDEGFQNISNAIAREAALAGISETRIFPPVQSGTRQQDQHELIRALTEGKLLVHFLGHGGRYVWRTGPPDYQDSTDLFSISDVEALPATRRLPLVLSMTCSSGPFDHPTAGSLAETFLRLPDRGAIGILAASWRVSDSRQFSQALVRELTIPGATIGEAVMNAKRAVNNRTLVESYNLLGNPAMQLSRPPATLPVSARSDGEVYAVTASLNPDQFPGGQAMIDWLDSTGQKLKTERVDLNGSRLEFRYPLSVGHSSPSLASVYVWSEVSETDAQGDIKLEQQSR